MLLFEWLAPPFAWKQWCLSYYMTCVIMRSIFASPGNKNCSHYLFTTYLVRKNADLIMEWRGNVTNESSPLTNRQRRDLEQFCCYRYTHWRQNSKDAGLGKGEHELKKKQQLGETVWKLFPVLGSPSWKVICSSGMDFGSLHAIVIQRVRGNACYATYHACNSKCLHQSEISF